jgi:taurine---2-oxoglutarate transaminase
MKNKSKIIYPWLKQNEKRHEILEFVDDNILKTSIGDFTDFSSLSFHSSFGFNNQKIKKEMEIQLSKSLLTYSKYFQKIQIQCADELLKILKLQGRIFFTSGGTESIEHALKTCRQHTNKKIILSRKKSYHGSTLGALQMTGDWRREVNFVPRTGHAWIPEPSQDPDFKKTIEIIKRLGPENIAGVCLESVTAKNGVYILPKPWIDGLKYIQNKYNIKIIFDEVVCGFYRTGKPFGFQMYNIKPDIVCMGKAISNGMAPLGATFFSSKIMRSYENAPFFGGLTNYGHPLSLSALRGVIKFTSLQSFRKKIIENEAIIFNWVQSISPYLKEYRGKGFLYGLELKKMICNDELKNQGISIIHKDNILIFCPIICLNKSKLKKDLNKLENFIKG